MANIYHKQYLVGQGGLHLGIIDDYTYIYDCGGYGKNVDWEQIFLEIKLKISKCRELYIFISHWHEDHSKKLSEMLDVIAPIGFPIFIYTTSTNQKNTIEANLEKIMYICEDMQKHGNNISRKYASFVINDIPQKWKNVTIEKDFINLPKELDNIILKPYITHLEPKEYEVFLNCIKDEAKNNDRHKKLNIESIILNLRSNINNKEFWIICSNAYTTYTKQILHKSKKEVNHQIMLCLYCGQTICNNKLYENWLHTGDALMKNTKELDGFINYYGSLLENITNFQIPHHGSRANHDNKFSRYFHCCYREFFITAQENPSKSTREVKPHLDDIIVCRWKPIAKISEKMKSYIFFNITGV